VKKAFNYFTLALSLGIMFMTILCILTIVFDIEAGKYAPDNAQKWGLFLYGVTGILGSYGLFCYAIARIEAPEPPSPLKKLEVDCTGKLAKRPKKRLKLFV
jgi:drug/metabolite transporter (DMT)-like permease